MIAEFNLLTGDHSKLSLLEPESPGSNTINVVFQRNTEEMVSPPTCTITRETAERKGSLEVRHSKYPLRNGFEIEVKEFASFQVRVFVAKVETKLGQGVEWKDRNTGAMHYEPNFYEKNPTNQYVFSSPTEFAGYILTLFTKHILEHRV